MQRIFEISQRLVRAVETRHYRFLYHEIGWTDRLILIKGARGVGKTTILKQRCKEVGETGLYASLDQLWFNEHTIVELVDYHYKRGGTHIFLDEVHLYPHKNWEQEVKNIYDSYPGYNIVITGSSLLQIDNKIGDLSRRVSTYILPGLSFREYLKFRGKVDFSSLSLSDILEKHVSKALEITSEIGGIIREFEKYLKAGWYPFFMDSTQFTYYQRVEGIVKTVLDIDIPAVTSIEYETQTKIKRLMMILADKVPFEPNTSKLSKDLNVSRSLIIKMLDLLGDAQIMRPLHVPSSQLKSAAKPEKILFDNPSIMYAIGMNPEKGTVRETFAASMLTQVGKLFTGVKGDFLLNKKLTFEVGGRKKGFSQIADMPDSFVLADDLETGFGNKIPLWLLGFLY